MKAASRGGYFFTLLVSQVCYCQKDQAPPAMTQVDTLRVQHVQGRSAQQPNGRRRAVVRPMGFSGFFHSSVTLLERSGSSGHHDDDDRECSNSHRMVHLRKPWPSMNDLKSSLLHK